MQLELRQIDTKYAALRVPDLKRRAHWTTHIISGAAIAPVTVVETEEKHRYTLIDGYLRYDILRQLAVDTIEVLVLPLSEDAALVRQLQLEGTRGRSALEEGWWIGALVNEHGRSLRSLAEELCRSTSWVCRRLALVQVLPEAVQDAVRDGRVPVQGAAKYLVPLSRDNAGACCTLVEHLDGEPVTVRQLASLYRGWNAADDDLRQHIITQPWTYLAVVEELSRKDTPVSASATEPKLLIALEQMTHYARQARRRLVNGEFASIRQTSWVRAVLSTWDAARDVLAVIDEQLSTTEVQDARSRDTDGNLHTLESGIEQTADRQDAQDIPQHGQTSSRQRPQGGAEDRET